MGLRQFGRRTVWSTGHISGISNWDAFQLIHLLFTIPFPKMPGHRMSEEYVPLVDCESSGAHNISGGLFDHIVIGFMYLVGP